MLELRDSSVVATSTLKKGVDNDKKVDKTSEQWIFLDPKIKP